MEWWKELTTTVCFTETPCHISIAILQTAKVASSCQSTNSTSLTIRIFPIITMDNNKSNTNKNRSNLQAVFRPLTGAREPSSSYSQRAMSPLDRWLNQAPNENPWNNVGAVSRDFAGNTSKSSQSCSEGAVWGSTTSRVSSKPRKQ